VLLSAGSSGAADAPTAPTVPTVPTVPSVTALLCGHLIDTAAGKVLGESTIVIEAGRVRRGAQWFAGAGRCDHDRFEVADLHARLDR